MSFRVSCVTDEKDLKKVFKLRYKVYCEEWGFEKPEKYPDRLETDEFDKNAIHFAVKNIDERIVATIRLILHSSEGFPAEKYCDVNADENKLPRESIAEISRLAISREYRRRSEDKYIYGPDEDRRSIGTFKTPYNHQHSKGRFRRNEDRYKGSKYDNGRSKGGMQNDRRNRHELVTCLYKAVYHESKRRNLTHWYAVMTKGLVILLGRYGFRFNEVGDPVDYHGIRTPYLGEIQKIEQEVFNSNPSVYEEFTKDLQNSKS